MALTIVAHFIKAYPTENVGQNSTPKRMFKVERSQMMGDEVVTKEIVFNVWKDRTKLLNTFKEGDKIEISFDIQSRENSKKEGQFFTDLTAYKIEKKGVAKQQEEAIEQTEELTEETKIANDDDNDSLPY